MVEPTANKMVYIALPSPVTTLKCFFDVVASVIIIHYYSLIYDNITQRVGTLKNEY